MQNINIIRVGALVAMVMTTFGCSSENDGASGPTGPISISEITNSTLASSELVNLLGTVNIDYVSSSGTQRNEKFVFDQDSYKSEFISVPGFEDWLVETKRTGAYGCTMPNIGEYQYLCFDFFILGDVLQSRDEFAFNLTTDTSGDGVYKTCLPAFDGPCTSSVRTDPDGAMTVTVNRLVIADTPSQRQASTTFAKGDASVNGNDIDAVVNELIFKTRLEENLR